MTRPNKPALSRRTLLGGTAAAGVGAVLASGTPAAADPGNRRNPIDQAAVDAVATRLDDGLIALRRDLHQHPETTGRETYTAAAVAGRLRAAGLDVTTGVGRIVVNGEELERTGIVAVLKGARPGRTVAYRADMDAVPGNGIVTSDRNHPAAHACGHDLHTTVGVGVAQVLAQLRNRLSGTVVFFFQPGEEGLAGARAMIDAGVLEDTGAEEIHALHCGPYPVGQFAVTPGSGLPGQDWARVTLAGADAPAAAGRLVTELGGLATVAPVPTPADAYLEQMVADVQTPDGPLARFVVIRARAADKPDAEGNVAVDVTFRCWPEDRNVEIREEIRRLAQPYAGAVVTYPKEPFPAMVCPENDAAALARHLRRVLGPGGVTVNHAAFPFNGEDYALFLDRIPGTYTFLGVRTPGAAITTSFPHYDQFTPDERAIGVGVRAMAGWLATRTRC
ncbi:M20/M25/M40 family metallo-hydrolase [Kitasatospora sp. NPDC047058]|uniref:M20 metallopeptidase family protein n=1 Tax=Kitasatospora sp. NPDC047058 TaxID=3155620 RepID=UPI0033C99A68